MAGGTIGGIASLDEVAELVDGPDPTNPDGMRRLWRRSGGGSPAEGGV